MTTYEARHVSETIRCPLAKAYDFLSEPTNLPLWAGGLGKSIRKSGETWIIESPTGPARLRFTKRNDHGILDHFISPDPGVEIYAPMRVIRNGDGCEVVFTLFRTPGMTDEKYAEDAAWVARDLQTLKGLLESD